MEDNCYNISDDYLDEDDDGIMYTTKDYISDSDEEDLAAFLRGKNKKKRHVEFDDDDDSSEDDSQMDDFEKEMAAELNETMEKILIPLRAKASTSDEGAENAEGENTHYDKIYFDSDEENESRSSSKRKDKHKVISNDDLFYDPLMDDEDQAWVDNNRRKYLLRSKKLKTKDGKFKPQALSQSDAVLNCPACFSTLCFDCQRHEIYKNQYRAMFVFNCNVDKSEKLHFALKENKKKKFKGGKKNKGKPMEENSFKVADDQEATLSLNNPDSETKEGNGNSEKKEGNGKSEEKEGSGNSEKKEGNEDEIFYAVKCALCNTKIAVQDEDEVFHFFNVLTSY